MKNRKTYAIGAVVLGISLLASVQFIDAKVFKSVNPFVKKSLFASSAGAGAAVAPSSSRQSGQKNQTANPSYSLGQALQAAVAEQNAGENQPQTQDQSAKPNQTQDSEANRQVQLQSDFDELARQLDTLVNATQADSVENVLPKAEAGDAEAQYQMAVNYRMGWNDVEKDPIEAFKWARLAAQQNHAKAQNDVGNAYRQGLGVEASNRAAARWFQRSASNGLAAGQNNYADRLFAGQGMVQNTDEALLWYERAALQGNSDAGFALIWAYREGNEIPQNYGKSFAWAEYVSREMPTGFSLFALAQFYDKGQGVPQNQLLAIEYYQRAAAEDWGDAQYELGMMYLEGRGVPKNRKQGVDWLQRAVINYSSPAKAKLAAMEIE